MEGPGQVADRPVGEGQHDPVQLVRRRGRLLLRSQLHQGHGVQREVGGIKSRCEVVEGGADRPGDIGFEKRPEPVPGHERPNLLPVLVGRHTPHVSHELEPAAGEGEPGLANDPGEGAPGRLGLFAGGDRRVVERLRHRHFVATLGRLAGRFGQTGHRGDPAGYHL